MKYIVHGSYRGYIHYGDEKVNALEPEMYYYIMVMLSPIHDDDKSAGIF